MPQYIPEIQLEDVQIRWRNFEGREENYNAPGQRNFHVVLPADVAEDMIKQGWNVKKKEPREVGDEPFYHMKVKVSFKFKAPRLTTVSKKWDPNKGQQKLVRNLLPEDLVLALDMFEFDKVDLILSPSRWNVRGESGVTAYVKTGFFFIHQDALEAKYAEIPYENENTLAIEGPDPAKDWIEGESTEWTEEEYSEDDELENPRRKELVR